MSQVDRVTASKELEALLSSHALERAPNLGILLQYVCGKVLAGRADDIKEYNIAVEAFGRAPDFDKRRDSIVRVEAHRLRKRLLEYYGQEGRNHDVQIVIPSGQYVPTFVRQGQEPPAAAPAGHVLARPIMVWAALAVLGVSGLTAAGAYLRRHREVRSARTIPAMPAPGVVAVPASAPSTVRILAGSSVQTLADPFGAEWSSDRYFTGGTAITVPFRNIGRTREPNLYLKAREGDFRYDIPLAPGVYEMRLFFAEALYGEGNIEGGGESSRLFRVSANDRSLLELFDVISDAGGPNTSDIKVFKDIQPASDGFLHLRFVSQKAFAFVNAIEIVPSEGGRLRPIRFVARATGFVDNQSRVWSPDSFYAGGRTVLRQEEVASATDPGIYQSERYGNFSYAIPVAAGSYTVILHFAETWHGPGRPDGGGAGSRIFDVYSNGATLLRNFDIFATAKGGYRALKKTFLGLHPNAQDKLLLSFVPTRNYACVNAIEVLDEGAERSRAR